jgi:transposase
LIRLAEKHPEWVLGYVDEVWWRRLAQPPLYSWAAAEPLRLIEQTAEKTDPDPKAVCCYGLLRAESEKIWLRFVGGRPVSSLTIKVLNWVLRQLAKEGKKALLVIWDNASWHLSHAVRGWMRTHNRKAKREKGVRILICQLPTKSPWLNRIEPYWVHGKRAVVEPERKLTARELIARICEYYGCKQLRHLSK